MAAFILGYASVEIDNRSLSHPQVRLEGIIRWSTTHQCDEAWEWVIGVLKIAFPFWQQNCNSVTLMMEIWIGQGVNALGDDCKFASSPPEIDLRKTMMARLLFNPCEYCSFTSIPRQATLVANVNFLLGSLWRNCAGKFFAAGRRSIIGPG